MLLLREGFVEELSQLSRHRGSQNLGSEPARPPHACPGRPTCLSPVCFPVLNAVLQTACLGNFLVSHSQAPQPSAPRI